MIGRRLFFFTALIAIAVVIALMVWPRPAPVPVTDRQAAVALDVALRQVGKPYVWSARGPDTFDSSGIIVFAYRQAIPGIRFRVGDGVWPRFSDDANHSDIHAWNFQSVPPDQLRPGDLLFISDGTQAVTHGALFVRWVEPYTVMAFVDASSRLMEVAIQTWPVDETVRGQSLVATGRLAIVPRDAALRHEPEGP